MANFFDYLPDVYYGVEVSKTYLEENSMEYVLGKNFFRSARIRDDISQYATLFTPYYIKPGMRPDMVSYQLYGDPELDWVILLTNDIFDAYVEWPKEPEELSNYVTEIYGAGNEVKTHHWETREVKDGDEIIHRGGLTVMPDYTAVNHKTGEAITTPAYEITNYEYEEDLNEKKRFIYVLDPNIIDQFIDEFETLCDYEDNEELEEDGAPLTEILEVGKYLSSQSGVAIYPTFGKYKNFIAAAQSIRATLEPVEVVSTAGSSSSSSVTGRSTGYTTGTTSSGTSGSSSSSSSSSSSGSSGSSGGSDGGY